MLHFEFCLRFDGITAASQDGGVGCFEFLDGVAKLGRFCRSTGRVRLGIKIQHQIFPAVIFERDRLPLVAGHFKFRSLVTFFEHLAFSSSLLPNLLRLAEGLASDWVLLEGD